MARIRTYESQVAPSGQSAAVKVSAESLGAGVGRSMQKLGASVATFGSEQEKSKIRNELSTLGERVSEKQQRFTDLQDEAVRTGKIDPDFSKKFIDNFDKEFEEVSGTVQTDEGRQYLTKAQNQLRLSFSKSSSAAQAQMMGAKAKNEYSSTVNNFSSALVSNPAMFEDNVKLHDESINNLIATGLPPVKAEELRVSGRKELAKSAAKGRIRLNPTQARDIINSGTFDTYLDGTDKYSLLEEADQEIRSRQVEGEQSAARVRRAQREKNRATQDEFFTKAINGQLTVDEVMRSDIAPYGTGSKDQFLRIIKRQSSEIAEGSNPLVIRDVIDRIHADEDDFGYIEDENDLAEFMGDGLSMDDVATLRRELQVKKQKPTEFQMKKKVLEQAKSALSKTNKTSGVFDEVGEKSVKEFTQYFSEEFDRRVQKGESPTEILDPESPKYIGRDIKKFQKTPQQDLFSGAKIKRQKEIMNGLTAQDRAAVDWAMKNKQNPENKDAAIKILQRNGLAE